MDNLIQFFITETPQVAFSLDSVIKFLGFVMILSTLELIACSLGKVRER